MTSEDSLEDLRHQIREIDLEILELVARRQALARRVGSAKRRLEIPIKNEAVEKQVIEASRLKAQALGIHEELAEKVFRALIEFSCKVQEDEATRAHLSQIAVRKILVVGGLGGMGKWFSDFFSQSGHEVSVFDTNVSVTSPYPRAVSLKEGACDRDVVVLATPISATSQVLDALVSLKPTALIFDACSIKGPILPALRRAQNAGLRVTSMHPLFGPQAVSLAGRHLLFCETGQKANTEAAAELFRHSAARFTFLPLEEHDKYMGYILGLSHLSNLVFSGTLAESGISYSELSSAGSTTFRAQNEVSRRVAAENPELYYEIQVENRATPAVVESFANTLQAFRTAIEKRDRKRFLELMDKGKVYFS